MTIKIEEIAKAVNKGLTIEEYIYLRIKEDGCEYIFNGIIPVKKEMLLLNSLIYPEGNLTPKGKELLKEISREKVSKKVDIGINQLYIACQEELQRLVGKKQKTSKISGKSYSFLPNFVDFQDKIEKSCKNIN